MPGQRIVLVESDLMWRKKIKSILAKQGYKVVGAVEDGISALKTIRVRLPDLVILDTGIAGIDGLEVAKIVCQDKIAPVIVIAASRSTQILQKAKEAGVSALLYKPIHEVELLSSVELVLAKHIEITRMENQITELKEVIENRKIIDKAKGILIQTMGFTEDEAFRKMQKQSMNNRISMRQVAEAIILAQDIKNS